jgi:anti-sigma-K factor RskA
MTTPNDQENRPATLNALHALNSLQPPAGMQDRLTQNLTERVRHQQLHPVARELKKYAWEMWAGASIAVVAAAVILCIFALQSHRTANQPQIAMVETHKINSAPTSTHAVKTNNPSHKAAGSYREQREVESAAIPHTPPPQPLTSQERLLLTLANSPSLAAGVAQSQTISQHGLGTNALFELDHEQLQPMRSESKLLQPLPPLPNNLP